MLQMIHLTFSWRDESPLFHQLTLNFSRQKHGLVGSNASGKSTLLALLAGRLAPSAGSILMDQLDLQYVPQLDTESTLESFDCRLLAAGRAQDWTFIEDQWSLYTKMEKELEVWGLQDVDFFDSTPKSGGTWQRLRLALALAHSHSFLLLDEPSNHLDRPGRQLLLQALSRHRGGCLIASHDRELLEAMDQIIDLQPRGVRVYGGGYSFYKNARDQEQAAQESLVKEAQQALDRGQRDAQRTREKQQKKNAAGHRIRDKGGIPRIILGGMKRQAETTTGKIPTTQLEKIIELQDDLRTQAERLNPIEALHFDARGEKRAGDRPILALDGVQQSFNDQPLWSKPLYLQLTAGEHLAITGANGSGKSVLLQLILGQREPTAGQIHRRFLRPFLLDQDLADLPLQKSLLAIWEDPLYILDQGLRRTIAARLGLKAREAKVPLQELSGGQRLRAALVLLATQALPPDLILLDEPSNHLDLAAIASLVQTLKALPATLIVVSHDSYFLEDLSVRTRLELC